MHGPESNQRSETLTDVWLGVSNCRHWVSLLFAPTMLPVRCLLTFSLNIFSDFISLILLGRLYIVYIYIYIYIYIFLFNSSLHLLQFLQCQTLLRAYTTIKLHKNINIQHFVIWWYHKIYFQYDLFSIGNTSLIK